MMKKVSGIFIVGILLCIAVYIGVFIGRTGTGNTLVLSDLQKQSYQDLEATDPYHRIDLNTATVDDLTDIPGVNKAVAKAIIEYREEYGDYYKVSELKDIDGISDDLYEVIRKYVTVED